MINPFFARVTNLIGQRVVVADGRSLRQRYNLSGTTRPRVEVRIAGQIARQLEVEADVLLLAVRPDRGDAPFRTLQQRPSHELHAAVHYQPSAIIAVRADIRRLGLAVDVGLAGQRVRLAPGEHVDLGARVAVAGTRDDGRLWLVGGSDNMFDATILPQLGLPLPDRMLRSGVQLD
jgi:hypothetical protein